MFFHIYNCTKSVITYLATLPHQRTSPITLKSYSEHLSSSNSKHLYLSLSETTLTIFGGIYYNIVKLDKIIEIQEEFSKKEKITISVDKTAIKNHFKETGEIVAGTRVIDNKTSLRIK